MKVLLVKMSSLGDVLHALPAVSDLYRTHQIKVDWAIEPAFAPLVEGHPGVNKIIPIPLRSYRVALFRHWRTGAIAKTIKHLKNESYDLIVDAQGLLKSALICKLAKGKRVGLASDSIREPLASRFYHQKVHVPWSIHAVERVRCLFAQVFDFDADSLPLDYGLEHVDFPDVEVPSQSVLFLHGTTWATKHWPVQYWQSLAEKVIAQGLSVLLPYGNDKELQRARVIKKSITHQDKVIILPKMGLLELASVMVQVKAVVAVDTGLGHLASALSVPCVSLYGATAFERTGTVGHNQIHCQANFDCAPCLKRTCALKGPFAINPPCFESVSPRKVFSHLEPLLLSSPLLSQRVC